MAHGNHPSRAITGLGLCRSWAGVGREREPHACHKVVSGGTHRGRGAGRGSWELRLKLRQLLCHLCELGLELSLAGGQRCLHRRCSQERLAALITLGRLQTARGLAAVRGRFAGVEPAPGFGATPGAVRLETRSGSTHPRRAGASSGDSAGAVSVVVLVCFLKNKKIKKGRNWGKVQVLRCPSTASYGRVSMGRDRHRAGRRRRR